MSLNEEAKLLNVTLPAELAAYYKDKNKVLGSGQFDLSYFYKNTIVAYFLSLIFKSKECIIVVT